jgi:hypothetical protein
MMMSLTRNLMIRRGMVPRNEGLRLHSINNRALGLFLRVSGFVQHGAQPERGYNAVLFFQLSGPRPVSSTLCLRRNLAWM